MNTDTQARLEYLRGELRAERISYGELYELQNMVDDIDPGDVELLEAAGVPEFPPTKVTTATLTFSLEWEGDDIPDDPRNTLLSVLAMEIDSISTYDSVVVQTKTESE